MDVTFISLIIRANGLPAIEKTFQNSNSVPENMTNLLYRPSFETEMVRCHAREDTLTAGFEPLETKRHGEAPECSRG